MTKEIIIDGVNVAGCQCFATAHVVMTASGILVKDIDNACTVKQKPCEEIKDCMFKRQFKHLKRLEQENNAYKQSEQEATEIIAELKHANKELIEDNLNLSKENRQMKSALEEIRKLVDCERCVFEGCDECSPNQCSLIENKINEVLK